MAGREIEWDSAEVRDRKLTVPIGGEASKEWSGRLQAVLHLLDRGGGRWGEISVSKSAIEVAAVREGSESELHHLLESAVLQANADLAPDEDPPEESDEDHREHGDDERADSDHTATEAFQAFGRSSPTEDRGEQGDGGGSDSESDPNGRSGKKA